MKRVYEEATAVHIHQGAAMQRIEAHLAVSLSELKESAAQIVNDIDDEAIAILDHDRIRAYMLSAEHYEALLEQLDDRVLAQIIAARAGETPVSVDPDDL